MWPVERRIDLCAIEPARVALEVRSRRVEANCRRARNRPTRRPDPNVSGSGHRRQRWRPARAAAATKGAGRVSAAAPMGHWDHGSVAGPLRARFASGLPLSRGLHHRRTRSEVLLQAIADVAFSDFEMRGVVARRRVAFFGQSYGRGRPRSRFRRSYCRCAPRLPSGPASIPTPSSWPCSTSTVLARRSAGIVTPRNTPSSQASRFCRHAE